MLLTPRYDGPDVLRIEVPLADPSIPLVRQRRRLGQTLSALAEGDWSVPSRCESWSVQDVVAHLVSTNQFWTLSISSALAGSPTRFLESFDPVATPAALVEPTRGLSPSAVLAQYTESVDGLAAAVTGLSDDAWSLPAEAPPGHIALRAVALHALWDAWTHERDIMLPLGLTQAAEPDEILGSLVYAAAIGPALLATCGSTRVGTLSVEADDPSIAFVVEAGPTVVVRDPSAGDAGGVGAGVGAGADAELRGQAVDLIEGLTFRAPLAHGVAAEHQWLLGGLDQAFDLVS
ncbi:MAG: hypothetical protein QOI20_2841 [Acidimicrobiaceae bacterium]|jgi:uncharacterized protein (TIGR03083 family)|nr:hypothetical protein [Acidimicrobiaceae bacterium]